MPLRDHFRPPLRDVCSWDSFHSAWAHEMVRQLNKRLLPRGFVARPHVKRGVQVEADVATLDRGERLPAPTQNGGAPVAVWAPSRPTLATAVDIARLDLFEVRVHHGSALELVAAVELVSPRNKDRPEARRAFAVKCASYLQQGVSVVVIDVVTERTINLHLAILDLLDRRSDAGDELPDLYAAAYRMVTPEEPVRLEAWVEPLPLGAVLPTVPLWLTAEQVIPLDLEVSYLATFDVLGIEP